MKIIGGHSQRPPITRKRLSVSGPPSPAAVSDPQALNKLPPPAARDFDVKSQSLPAVEFDNRGFPRQPRSRGDQELVACAGPCQAGPRAERFVGTHDDRCQRSANCNQLLQHVLAAWPSSILSDLGNSKLHAMAHAKVALRAGEPHQASRQCW